MTANRNRKHSYVLTDRCSVITPKEQRHTQKRPRWQKIQIHTTRMRMQANKMTYEKAKAYG